jgi:hypothetical protein
MAPRRVRPAICIVCTHPRRAQIEMLRAGGATLRAIAKRFGEPINKDSISRHFRNHVSRERRAELLAGPARVEQLANAAADESRSLLEQLQIVRSVLLNQFLVSAEAGDRQAMVGVAGQLIQALRELGRATGELRELSGVTINQSVLNLFTSPEFARLQEGLLKVARAHPGARADIIALLRSLNSAPSVAVAGGLAANADRTAPGVQCMRPGVASSNPPMIECTPADAA